MSATTPPAATAEPKSQNCPACQASDKNPLSGLAQMTCPHCCARLVAKTRPDKSQAKAMLAAIARQPGCPPRELVLALVEKRLQG